MESGSGYAHDMLHAHQTPESVEVLSKAVTRAAEMLGVSLMVQNIKESDALLFVEMFRSLLASVGGDESMARSWLMSENLALNCKPIDLIFSTSGLVRVVEYLERGRGH